MAGVIENKWDSNTIYCTLALAPTQPTDAWEAQQQF